MDTGVFYEVIVPLLGVKGSSLICISTALGRRNFYTQLTEVKDENDKLLFNVIKVGTVCERCRGTENEADCRHPATNMPDWKDEDGQDTMRAIYGMEHQTLLKRETMGLVADDERMAFNGNHLDKFFKAPPAREPHNRVDQVFVAIDPNGGGVTQTGSETAIVSFFYAGPHIVVSSIRTAALVGRPAHVGCRISRQTNGVLGNAGPDKVPERQLTLKEEFQFPKHGLFPLAKGNAVRATHVHVRVRHGRRAVVCLERAFGQQHKEEQCRLHVPGVPAHGVQLGARAAFGGGRQLSLNRARHVCKHLIKVLP